MEKYHLNHTDLEVTRIAFGCMRMAGNEEKGLRAVQMALDCGINFFDHADIYGGGQSESAFAAIWKLHRNLREKIILQTKCGIRFENSPQGAPPRFDFSYEHILASVEGSLRRLETDYIDILLLHRPDPLVEPEEVAKAFSELKASGKVRYFGVSNHNAAQIELLSAYVTEPLVANQLEVSVAHDRLIEEGVIFNQNTLDEPVRGSGTLEYCRLKKIMIQAWSPLAGGALAGLRGPLNPVQVKLNAEIESIASDYQVSSEAVMLAWLLRHPAGIQPILGSMTPARVKSACAADEINLSREEWYRIYNAGKGYHLP